MGYQALLFCPDDRTARTVTQVLSELEFSVEACIEPFAAVKKLMGQHFDAVVVDCDNEQNATLLFKSARNSTSNQTSLAVAVVEGQAGVAKAFRIGANLVLTKPINIEQTKGTLRVARGLLRKSDPTKPGTATGTFAIPTAPTGTPVSAAATPTAAATSTPAAMKPAAPKPAATTRPAAPAPIAPKPAATATFKAPQAPTAKPAAPPAWPTAAASAKPAPVVQAAPAVTEKPVAPPAPAAPPPLYSAVLATPAEKLAVPAPREIKPPAASAPAASGAASAPAPARETPAPRIQERPAPSAAEDLFEKPVEIEKPAESASSESPAYVGAAPSFSFGGSTAETESSGGAGKKAFIGIAAVALIAAGGYFGWSHFKGGSSAAQPVAISTSSAPSAAPKPVSVQPSTQPGTAVAEPAKPSPVQQPDITIGTSANPSSEENETSTRGAAAKPSASAAKSANISTAPAKPAVADKVIAEEEPETPALVVKGGKVPASAKPAPAPDAPAPSLIGMGGPADTALPNLGTSNSDFKPTLQTLSVSQGVSQGLLYKKVAPTYPMNALRMHIAGIVQLQATISKTGDITQVKVISGDMQLTKAASDAVKQWKYKPYLLNGEPVEIQTQVTVNFKLPH